MAILERVWLDVRYGARTLLKNPGFTIVAVVSIAMGIGANAAMFSLADALALRPLQVPRSSEVVAVTGTGGQEDAGFAGGSQPISYLDYIDLRDHTRTFAGLAAYHVVITSFTNRADEPPQSRLGLAVSSNFFDVLQVPPSIGRSFVAQEGRVPGRDPVLVLAYDAWQQQFGADRGIIGRHLRLGGVDFTVIGVAPESFPGMDLVLHPAYYVPLTMVPSLAGYSAGPLDQRDVRILSVRGRLKDGVSLAQADSEVRGFGHELQRLHPDTNARVDFRATSDLAERRASRGPATPAAWTLMLLAMVVLLVACANVAGLLISRAPVRAPEMALRLAVGGSRVRLIEQLLTESALIAFAGAFTGLALAYGAIILFRQLPIVSDLGVRLTVQLDQRVLLLTLVLTTLSAVAAGTLPAWRTTVMPNLVAALGRTVGADGPRRRLWGRQLLVATQVALALTVLTTAAFLYRTFGAEFGRPGFRTYRMLLVNFDPSLARYDDDQAARFYRLLEDRVRGLPGVTAVGLTSVMPLNQDHREVTALVPEGYELPRGIDRINVSSARVDDGYLTTMGVPVLAGRNITRADTADTAPVAVINEAMANRYWPRGSAIGKRFRLAGDSERWIQVVGIVSTGKYNWIGEAPTPFVYLPQAQSPGSRATLLVAVTADEAALAPEIRHAIHELDSNMPVSAMRTMEEFYYGSAVSALSQFLHVVGAIGLMGVSLAMVGLYGLVSYSARRRTREIAVRMAVGAQPRSILSMIIRQGVVLAVAGMVLGVFASFVAGRALIALVPGSNGIDLGTYLLVVPALMAITVLAAMVPAWRAARIDPLVAMRVQ